MHGPVQMIGLYWEYWLWKPFIVPSSHTASASQFLQAVQFFMLTIIKRQTSKIMHTEANTHLHNLARCEEGHFSFCSSGSSLSNPSVREEKKQSQPLFSKSHIVKVISRPACPHLRPLKKDLNTSHTLVFGSVFFFYLHPSFFKRPLRTELHEVEASMAFI